MLGKIRFCHLLVPADIPLINPQLPEVVSGFDHFDFQLKTVGNHCIGAPKNGNGLLAIREKQLYRILTEIFAKLQIKGCQIIIFQIQSIR